MTEEIANRKFIVRELIAVLEEMSSDWDIELDAKISEDTKLIADLEFESIDVVQLIVSIEQRFKKKKLPFEKLIMSDGRYVDEILVRDAVDFLAANLAEGS